MMRSLARMEIFVTLILSSMLPLGVVQSHPMVMLSEGMIEGKTVIFNEDKYLNVSKAVDVFLGVPFAEPPVRFSPPVPKASWEGVLETKTFKPACMQPIYNNFPNVSEDCLYLNVYVPNPRPHSAAVLVYIHGGTFVTGSAMTYTYYGVPLAAVGDVIIVTINYRVGIFARFSTGNADSRGCYGMLDQVEALHWVQRNIGVFGGDKDSVTLFGGSAGSASVHFHMLSKLSRRLFSQAVMQSGNAYSLWAFRDVPMDADRNRAKRLAQSMRCPTSSLTGMVECLRMKDAKMLLRTAGRIYGRYQIHVDGLFLEDTPSNLYRLGEFKQCPILAGYNKDEGTLTPYFSYWGHRGKRTPPRIPLRAAQNHVTTLMTGMGFTGSTMRSAALELFTDWSMDAVTGDFFRTFVDAETDVYYACTTDKVLRAHATGGSHQIFKYIFTHEPTKSQFQFRDVIPSTPWLKAGHAEELTFVSGMPFIDELYYVRGHNMTEEEKKLSIQIMTLWANFAKSGDPNQPDSEDGSVIDSIPHWSPFTLEGLDHKEVSPAFINGRAARARQCHFLNFYMPQLKTSTASLTEVERHWRRDYQSWQSDYATWRRKFADSSTDAQ